MDNKEIKFEIKKHIKVLGESSGGWKTELNIVSWNDRDPKLDIRPWDSTHKRMGKGITLTKEEAENLSEGLKIYLEEKV